MRVSEIMTREVQTARAEDSVGDVARRMAEHDVGALPVCDGRSLTGIVTDRDIVMRAVAKGLDGAATVREIMSREVETVGEDDDLDEVHERMSALQVRRLPVVNERGELIGIVALADVARRDKAKDTGKTL